MSLGVCHSNALLRIIIQRCCEAERPLVLPSIMSALHDIGPRNNHVLVFIY